MLNEEIKSLEEETPIAFFAQISQLFKFFCIFFLYPSFCSHPL